MVPPRKRPAREPGDDDGPSRRRASGAPAAGARRPGPRRTDRPQGERGAGTGRPGARRPRPGDGDKTGRPARSDDRRSGRPPRDRDGDASRRRTDRPRTGDGRSDRRPRRDEAPTGRRPVEKRAGWGGVARRGAGVVREPADGTASKAWRDAAEAEAERRSTRPAAWEPEVWID